MKTVAVCVVCALGAFFVMTLYLSGQLGGSDEPADEAAVSKKQEPLPPTKFPHDLAPATRGEPVPRAADFKADSPDHPTAVLDRAGKLHEWHTRLHPDWQADSVEITELVLVVSKQRRTLLQVITYASGAPPVRRYQYDLDAWLVEAKTGREIDRKRFTTVARPIRPRELWDLTELGDPVEWATVDDWMRERAATYADRFLSSK
jgi:hypothetical protein